MLIIHFGWLYLLLIFFILTANQILGIVYIYSKNQIYQLCVQTNFYSVSIIKTTH